MKTRLEHRIPLSNEALQVLHRVQKLDEKLIFPSSKNSSAGEARQQSDNVFNALYRRMKVSGFTTHGFRSTFRDWCSEKDRSNRDVAEISLSHSVGNRVERAYARSDLFERRNELMARWGKYASGDNTTLVRLVT
jgi:integrase